MVYSTLDKKDNIYRIDEKQKIHSFKRQKSTSGSIIWIKHVTEFSSGLFNTGTLLLIIYTSYIIINIIH